MHGHFFAAARRAGNQSRFRDVCRHGDADAAEKLDSFRDRVHEFVLLAVMLVEEQMELVERHSRDLPVVFLVHVAQRHGVGEELIQVVGAGGADPFVEGDR